MTHCALLGIAAWLIPAAQAADHIDAPLSSVDPAADIADFFAWSRHGEEDKVIAAITFAGAGASTSEGVYDDEVLYTIHIDTDGDAEPDENVYIRFGESSSGDWGVQVLGLPGGDATVEGPVETEIDAGNGLTVYAGLRDDPFFFDFTGYSDTLSTATLSFTGADFFAGLNVTAIVVEIDIDAIGGSSNDVQIWATTGRL